MITGSVSANVSIREYMYSNKLIVIPESLSNCKGVGWQIIVTLP